MILYLKYSSSFITNKKRLISDVAFIMEYPFGAKSLSIFPFILTKGSAKAFLIHKDSMVT